MVFLGTHFSFKNNGFFIHIQTMGLDLILYWKTRNYPKIILLNLKMFLCAWFLCYHKRSSSIQNLFQKLSIFKTECSSSEIWDCQWHKTFSVTPVFTALILLLFFKLSKYINVVVLLLLIFYFYLLSPMPLRLVE